MEYENTTRHTTRKLSSQSASIGKLFTEMLVDKIILCNVIIFKALFLGRHHVCRPLDCTQF